MSPVNIMQYNAFLTLQPRPDLLHRIHPEHPSAPIHKHAYVSAKSALTYFGVCIFMCVHAGVQWRPFMFECSQLLENS